MANNNGKEKIWKEKKKKVRKYFRLNHCETMVRTRYYINPYTFDFEEICIEERPEPDQ